jgi:hypothetical protein
MSSSIGKLVQVAGEVVSGALGGNEASIAGAAGRVLAATVAPELKVGQTVAALFDAVRNKDVAKAIGLGIGCLPSGKTVTREVKAAAAATTEAASEVREQIAKEGVSKTALHHANVVGRRTVAVATAAGAAAKKLVDDPKLRDGAAERAWDATVDQLRKRLLGAADEGREVITVPDPDKPAPSFSQARDDMARFLEVLEPKGVVNLKGWRKVVDALDDGTKVVRGKHKAVPDPSNKDEAISQKGFVFLPHDLDPNDPTTQKTLAMLAWNGDQMSVHTFQASYPEATRIFERYLDQGKAFASTRGRNGPKTSAA